MKMSFAVACVKEHLIKHGLVYTVRGKTIDYGPPIDTVKGRGCFVEVMGVGRCFVQKVSPTTIDHPVILEHSGYVPYSGFKTIEEWWAKIEAFHAVGGYLWKVERMSQ